MKINNRSLNKPLNKTLIVTSILSLAISAFTQSNYAEGKTNADVVIATVNGDNIMKSTLDGYMKVLKKTGKEEKQAALDDLIATEVALQAARKTDILERPEIKKTISDYTRSVLLKTWTKEKVDSFSFTDEEIQALYQERISKLISKEYNARHILVKTEDEAKAIIKELQAGADFAAIAKEKSTGPSGSNGGSLGWFKAQTMVPAFAAAVKSMKKGDISKEPVKTQFGYHIIKIEDSRISKAPTLESLKPQLKRILAQRKMLTYMLDLTKKADIKITLPPEPTATEKPADPQQ